MQRGNVSAIFKIDIAAYSPSTRMAMVYLPIVRQIQTGTASATETNGDAGSDPDDPDSTPSDKNGDGKLDNPSADTDGDGISDGDEIAAGSDPDDPDSNAVRQKR